ncbi:MAG: RNA polymerase factor sigma-54 [Bdellovibrionaceae bacterium]|nr:RNA polymerase factor sigma-54 [Pseudobdellovibrionaceae bacterium]
MKLSQQLKMSPQLQQAIKLLQVSRLELASSIQNELVNNPLLEEMVETIDPEEASRKKESVESDSNLEELGDVSDFETGANSDLDWRKLNKSVLALSMQGKDDLNYEQILSKSVSLAEHLEWQVQVSILDKEQKELAYLLIDSIDDDGYLSTALEEISKSSDVDLEDLEEVLLHIQEMDPPGVGARNLQESLILQAKHHQEDTPDILNIINNHFSDLEKKDFKAIAQALNYDVKLTKELCEIILNFSPQPGQAFTVTSAGTYVSPDIYIAKNAEEYVIFLNQEGLPSLQISPSYKDWKNDKKMKSYVDEKFKSAVWIIRSLYQRQKTIYRVTECILKRQLDFFEKGPEYLKPMILKDVSQEIDVHESTVSRVVSNKYVHTPRGLLSLKYFFNSAVACTDGKLISSASVKTKIKKIIAKEDPARPFSDQKLTKYLETEGIQVARRTVAKYRELLKISPASKRKKSA